VVTLGDTSVPGVVPLSVLLATTTTLPALGVDPDSIALLPYSSGTTGLPKGVMLTHRQVVTACRQIAAAAGVGPHDVTVAVAPWFHIMGVTAELLVPLISGATVISVARFERNTFMHHLDRFRASYVIVPPPIATAVAHHSTVDERRLPHLELIGVGGAPLSPAVQDALTRRLPNCVIGQGWGLTETAGAVCVPARTRNTTPGTVGTPLPNTEVRVTDLATRRLLPAETTGELEVRGPQTMLGYLHQPDVTAAMIDTDGWVRTGDLGQLNIDGEVVVLDRIKELIKVNADQVAPAEVEAVLLEHPAVVDAAVIARPHERTGETPAAYLVTDGTAPTPELATELATWAEARLSPYKRPSSIDFVSALPRNASGKLLRRQLPLGQR
jgi:acyl-CoA synthetase (AMP-forming)/AMP-acid ligase II